MSNFESSPARRRLVSRSGSNRTLVAASIAVAATFAAQELLQGAIARLPSADAIRPLFSFVTSMGLFGVVYLVYRLTVEKIMDAWDGIEPRLSGRWWYLMTYRAGEADDYRVGTGTISTNNGEVVLHGTNFRESADSPPSSVWHSQAVGIEENRVSLLYSHASAGRLGAQGLMILDLGRSNGSWVLTGTFSDADRDGHLGQIRWFKSRADFDAALGASPLKRTTKIEA